MKIIRWIFGFPLATVISLGIFYLAIEYGLRGFYSSRLFAVTYIYRLAVIFFTFALWIFLTCLFSPSPRKIAGIIPIAAGTIFMGIIIYLNARDQYGARLNQTTLIAFSAFYVGMIIGYFMSYLIFKDKGWHGSKRKSRAAEFEL
ncbi:MAG TPA: hypothetical protein VFE54_04000 [Mucilaginibacter sp.]|jgi:tetrahydromethanopterin S-methyltransferase subunit E|nr:hypothetical protein [Mucilaginibacter sp.]